MTESLQHVSKNVRLVSVCTIASRILGLLRDQAMGAIFGAGWVFDAFTVAFRLPNLARVLLGEGALTTAFLPVLVSDLRERGRESAANVTWAVFITLCSVLCSLIAVIELGLWGIRQFVPLSPEAGLLCSLMAVLMPYVLLICLAAQIGATLNALGRFLWPALVPAILNLVWLIALWLFVPRWPDEIEQIHVTAVFVVMGGAAQLVFPLPALYFSGFGYRREWRSAMDRVWRIAAEMLPVILGLSITQLNAVLDSFIAWGFSQPRGGSAIMSLPGAPHYPLSEGTAAALYLGQRLYQFPLGVFGVALGTVLFPLLTSHAQRGEMNRLKADLSLGIRLVIAIGFPASAGLMSIAHPLAVLFFQYGHFDAVAAEHTGTMIAMYGSGVWAYCGLLILQRGFYAIGDRLTPMYVGLLAMIGNVVLDLTLIWPFGGRGLALSTALIAATQCAVSLFLLQQKVGQMHWREIGITTFKTLTATSAMVIACWLTFALLEGQSLPFGRAIRLGLPLSLGGVVYLLIARLVKLSEPWVLLVGHRTNRDENADRNEPA